MCVALITMHSVFASVKLYCLLMLLGTDYNFFSSHATEYHQNIIKASGSMERRLQLNHF